MPKGPEPLSSIVEDLSLDLPPCWDLGKQPEREGTNGHDLFSMLRRANFKFPFKLCLFAENGWIEHSYGELSSKVLISI